MNGLITTKVKCIGSTLVFVLMSALTFAGPDTDAPTKTVSYGDLKMSSPKDVATLVRRIRSAAEEVCGPATITGSFVVQPAHRQCVERAVSQAVAKIDSPALTAFYAKNGQYTVVQMRSATLRR
jgi:UrcA family protein